MPGPHRPHPPPSPSFRKSEKSWAAFEHNHKEHYNDPVPTKDRQLIRTFAETFPDTSCHGCVACETLEVQNAILDITNWPLNITELPATSTIE